MALLYPLIIIDCVYNADSALAFFQDSDSLYGSIWNRDYESAHFQFWKMMVWRLLQVMLFCAPEQVFSFSGNSSRSDAFRQI